MSGKKSSTRCDGRSCIRFWLLRIPGALVWLVVWSFLLKPTISQLHDPYNHTDSIDLLLLSSESRMFLCIHHKCNSLCIVQSNIQLKRSYSYNNGNGHGHIQRKRNEWMPLLNSKINIHGYFELLSMSCFYLITKWISDS